MEMIVRNTIRWVTFLSILLAVLIAALNVGVTFSLLKSPGRGGGSDPANSGNKGGGVGTGELYVYLDESRKKEAPTNPAEAYLVLYGRLYYFTIKGITEYGEGETIHIWAHYQDGDHLIGDYTVGPGGTIDFEWTIPTLPYQTEIKYKYGLSLTGSNSSWRFAKRTTRGVGLTLVIPQVSFGVLGATSAFVAAYSIKALTGKRRFFSK